MAAAHGGAEAYLAGAPGLYCCWWAWRRNWHCLGVGALHWAIDAPWRAHGTGIMPAVAGVRHAPPADRSCCSAAMRLHRGRRRITRAGKHRRRACRRDLGASCECRTGSQGHRHLLSVGDDHQLGEERRVAQLGHDDPLDAGAERLEHVPDEIVGHRPRCLDALEGEGDGGRLGGADEDGQRPAQAISLLQEEHRRVGLQVHPNCSESNLDHERKLPGLPRFRPAPSSPGMKTSGTAR